MTELEIKLGEALHAINQAWNTRNHGQDTHSFHFWYAAYIEDFEDLIKEYTDARTG